MSAIREQIFDPFFTTKELSVGEQAKAWRSRVRIVVDKHGGELTFETDVGKGTTFFIRLPIHVPATESVADLATAAA